MIVIAFLGLAVTSCKKNELFTPAKDGAQIEMLTPTMVIFQTTDTIATVTTSAYLPGKMISMSNISYSQAVFTINGREYKLKGRD